MAVAAIQSISGGYSSDVSAVYRDCLRSLYLQKKWSDEAGKKGNPAVSGKKYSSVDIKALTISIEAHCRSLERIKKEGNQFRQRKMAETLVLPSFHSHVCAVLRAHARCSRYISREGIVEAADQSKQWALLTEEITAQWHWKSKGGLRLIRSEGPRRTARRLVIRDLLQVMQVDSNIDYSRKGAGGERAFVEQVCKSIDGGFRWWWTPDIKSYFASLRPSHLKWLPLTRQLVKNDVFTPSCAKVRVIIPKDVDKILHALQKQYPSPNVMTISEMISFTVQKVRLGLPEGSTLSPLLARGFVGRELRTLFGTPGIAKSSFMDDLAIGARSRKNIETAVIVLTGRLLSHPAGPIELHALKPRDAFGWAKGGKEIELLGYKLQPGNGYGATKVHVKPGSRRLSRFEVKLREKLKNADKSLEPYDVGLNYWRQWFQSQQAWTKVPGCSELVSECIALSYIDDYLHGMPLGKHANYLNKSC
jgi:hypothetical protein